MDSKNKYTPISCSFYDRIEASIVLRKTVSLVYHTPSGEEKLLETRLQDTQTKEGEEFVVLASGEKIRMDRIVSLDGEALLGSC